MGEERRRYALYRRGTLYYVGLATDLPVRLKQHLSDRHRGAWDQFSLYLTIGDQHLRELESLVVRIVSPRGNRQTGRFANSNDLLPLLRRAFRNHSRQKESELFDGLLLALPRATSGKGTSSAVATPRELAHYVHATMRLRAKYKGRRLNALVRPDGTIRFAGKLFESPSGAARSVVDRPISGWVFWECERAPGDWVRLGELRR